MRRHGLPLPGRSMTTGIEHGCEQALTGAAARRDPGRGQRRRADRQGRRRRSPRAGTPLGVIPGGRGNDLARVVGIPADPAGAVAVLAAGERRRIDVGEANGERFLCIASCGFDSDANRIANEARAVRGPLVYAYAALKALCAVDARLGSRSSLDGEEHSVQRLLGRRRQLEGLRRRHVRRPRRRARRRPARRRHDRRRAPSGGSCQGLPKVFKGDARRRARGGRRTGPAMVEVSADRPFAVYADGDHLTDLPMTVRVLPGALELIAPAEADERRAGRRPSAARGSSARRCGARGRSASSAAAAAAAAARRFPGRVLLRAGAGRDRRGSASRLERRADDHQRHQRQDDDRRHARVRPARGRPRARSTTGPARTWPGASRPRCSSSEGDEGLFEVDEAWLPRVAADSSPRPCSSSATSSATSSTATASSSDRPTTGRS